MSLPMPESAEPYRVALDGLFEGPMDLLVHLIKKNEVDIHDIPIALITRQYIEYIELMQDLQLGRDFVVPLQKNKRTH